MKIVSKFVLTSAVVIGMAGCGESSQPTVYKAAPAAAVQIDLTQISKKLDGTPILHLDGINGVISPPSGSVTPIKGEKVEIYGFGVDSVKSEAAAGILVLIDGKPRVATYGMERADIAKALNNPKYLKSQFHVAIPVAEIGAGQHEVKFRLIASDQSGYYEDGWVGRIEIKK